MGAQHVPGDVGAMLRQARERRGLSLRQISNATKIAMITLEALERNDVARLPGGIFSRSFVRAYAVEVGLDPDTVIEEFMGQFPQDSVTAGHPTTSQIEDHEAVESDRRMATTFLRLLAISIPLAVVVGYFATAGRRATQNASEPASQQAAPAKHEPEAAPAEPVADTHEAAAATEPPATSRQPAAPGGGVPAASPQPAASRVTAPASAAASAVPGDRLMVQVSASRRAWISATVDGTSAARREFMPGEDATFEVHKEIVLTAGDAGGVAVMLNGMPARPLGGNGQVVTLRVNPTNYRNYLVTP